MSILNVINEFEKNRSNSLQWMYKKYPEKTNPIWVTKNLKEIPVAYMTDDHIVAYLRNLKAVKRMLNTATFDSFHNPRRNVDAWIKVFYKETNKRNLMVVSCGKLMGS